MDKYKQALINNDIISIKCFFIDGPGGSGKTYIYKAICHLVLSMSKIFSCTAYTGIASTLLMEGRTLHNRFGLLHNRLVTNSII